MWNKPWTIKEGAVIGLGLIISGAMLQYTAGPLYWQIFVWPANIYALVLLIAVIGCMYAFRHKIYAFNFIMTWQSTVAALSYAVILTIIMGITTQVTTESEAADPIGFSKMLNFWPFILIYIWLTIIVGMVTIKEIAHFKLRLLPALANHLGLFIVLTAGTLGSADMQRNKMYCEKGQPEWRVLNEGNQTIELPIAVQLNEFIMEEYPPKLIIIDNQTQQAVMKNGKPISLTLDSTFTSGQLGYWTITLKERKSEDVVRVTANLSALIKTADMKMKHSEGIVSCGNYMMPPQMIALGKQYSLAMPAREPKRYASKVEVVTKDGKHVEAVIDVNKPLSINGWKIYQYSYNTQMGKYSNYSVLEFVTDPWQPVVYIGIGLLFIGAIGLFFTKK